MVTPTEELLDLERQYWQAIKDHDGDAAARLTDEVCIVAGAQGVASLDKRRLSAMLKAASYTLDRFVLADNPQVRLLGDGIAMIAYEVHEELTIDGKRVELDAADSSIWVRRDGRWRCAMHTEAIAGDPYGRDRAKA
jgi:hypothetical protein